MRLNTALLTLAVALMAVVISHGQRTTVAVVQGAENADASLDVIRKQVDGRIIGRLPRSGLEVWEVDPSSTERLEHLLASGELQHLELGDQRIPSVVAKESVSLQQLNLEQRAMVEQVAGSLASPDYRVSDRRPALLSADLLEANLGSGAISIELLDGRSALFRRVGDLRRRSGGEFTWSGQLMGGSGTATLVVRPQGITGQVSVNGEIYSITPLGDGQHLIAKPSPRELQLPDHPPESDAAGAPPDAAGDVPATQCKTEDTEADLLVFYTEAAKKSRTDIEGVILLAVEVTIKALRESNTHASVKLVGARELAYRESGNLVTDLDAVAGMSKVIDARNEAKADIVITLLASGNACGWAKAIPATPDTAFAVVLTPQALCPLERFSFTHEIGHLYGMRHENDNRTPYVFGRGFALKDARDIMATDSSCAGCPRLGLFSNPQLKHDGQPLGSPDCCDNARVLRDHTAKVVSRFRCRS